MTIKALLSAVLLSVLPGLALANGCSGDHRDTAMSCPAGTTLDSESGSCVPGSTS